MKNKSPASILKKFAWINGYIVVIANISYAFYMYQNGNRGLQLLSPPLILVSVALWALSLAFLKQMIKKKMQMYPEQTGRKK